MIESTMAKRRTTRMDMDLDDFFSSDDLSKTLDERRESLCLRFAKRCIKNEKTTKMFPLNNKKHIMNTRNIEKYKVEYANTERFKTSPIIYMQNLLNRNEES